jgi:hypothetical protein
LSVTFGLGAAVGAAAASMALLWSTHRKAMVLQGLDLHLNDPGVPLNVLDAVRAAEIGEYRRMAAARKVVEDGQDAVGLIWPRAVYRANYSVGAYRLKSQTAVGLVDYAIERGFLQMNIERDDKYARIMPLLAQQPALNSWFAAVLLSRLREQHPALRNRDWADIAVDGDAIAKLYSGYTGAGGAWDAWEADEVPGPVARERLGYDPESGEYSAIATVR